MPALSAGPLRGRGLAAAPAGGGVAAALFVGWTVLTATGRLTGLDSRAYTALRVESGPAHEVMRDAALLAGAEATVAWVVLLTVASVIVRRLFPVAVGLAAGLAVTGAVELALKTHLDHPGPPTSTTGGTDRYAVLIDTAFSYPSGHMIRAVLGTTAAVVALRLRVAAAIAVVLAVAVAVFVTRLALGGHWLSDAVGGALLGAALAPLVMVAGGWAGRRPALASRPGEPGSAAVRRVANRVGAAAGEAERRGSG